MLRLCFNIHRINVTSLTSRPSHSLSTLSPLSEHVLVFLTGKDEIESAAKVLHRKAMSQDSSAILKHCFTFLFVAVFGINFCNSLLFQSSELPALVVLPFYSALSQDLQEKVFQPVPEVGGL